MARHNREGRGEDQHGHSYSVNYQPDWLHRVKVSRTLDTGRRSTMTLFQNPSSRREAPPGNRIRTRISSPEQGVDLQINVTDPNHRVRKVVVHYAVPHPDGGEEDVAITLEDGLRPPADD